MKKHGFLAIALTLSLALIALPVGKQEKIYWGKEVPAGMFGAS